MIPKEFKKFKPVFFDRGKRSYVYKFKKGGKEFAIKTKKPDLNFDTLKNEARFLRLLNKKGIGPKIIGEGKSYVAYEFVKGERFIDWLEKSKNPLKVIKKVLWFCRVMDKLKINKKEMHKPVKHILVYNNKPQMIDFERCYFTKKPKNLTQFCQFLISKDISKILNKKGFIINRIRLVQILKSYKKEETDKNYNQVISILDSSKKAF